MTIRIVAGPDVFGDASMTIVLIITHSHARAARIAIARNIAGEWRQFGSREIAEHWIDRCVERGCEMDVTWLYSGSGL